MEKKEEEMKIQDSAVTQSLGASLPTGQHHQGQAIKFSESSALNIQGQISVLSKWGPSHTLLLKRVFCRNYLEKTSACLRASGDNNERLSESSSCLAEPFWETKLKCLCSLLNWAHDRRVLGGFVGFFFICLWVFLWFVVVVVFSSSWPFLKTKAFFQSVTYIYHSNLFSCFFPEAFTFLDSYDNIYHWYFCIGIKVAQYLTMLFLKKCFCY